MDVLVLPSHREGLGLAPLEAQAMGVPAIVTKHTGCRETIIEHETGEFVDMTTNSIYEKLEMLFNNRDYAKQLGQNGREFVARNFEASVVNENILKYLNNLTR